MGRVTLGRSCAVAATILGFVLLVWYNFSTVTSTDSFSLLWSTKAVEFKPNASLAFFAEVPNNRSEALNNTHASLPFSAKSARAFFSDILVLIMMSPPRYFLAPLVKKHYAPFFSSMIFCGPKANSSFGIPIEGYDIAYGNRQYLAVSAVLDSLLRLKPPKRAGVEASSSTFYRGLLYIADDLLFHPWHVAQRRLNKSIPWAPMMGIANVLDRSHVRAVPGMSVQRRTRQAWPYWRKNFPRLRKVLIHGGNLWRNAMRAAAMNTSADIYRASRYAASFTHQKSWAVFFTIADCYFVPREGWKSFVRGSALMNHQWVHGELAIPTILRFISPQYEMLDFQFYWDTVSAADCHRYYWSFKLDGFHRCRHDHPFARLLYDSDETRATLQQSAVRKWALRLSFNSSLNESKRRISK